MGDITRHATNYKAMLRDMKAMYSEALNENIALEFKVMELEKQITELEEKCFTAWSDGYNYGYKKGQGK